MKRINVSSRDILFGFPYESDYCPIAIALKRQFPDKDVSVSESGRIEIGDEVVFLSQKTLNKVVDFVKRFDSGEDVKPFRFRIYPSPVA